MKKLIAQRPILYLGRTYKRGDALPAHDSKMVAAWLQAKSAAWSCQENRQEIKDGQEPAGDGKPAENSRKAAKSGKSNGGDQ